MIVKTRNEPEPRSDEAINAAIGRARGILRRPQGADRFHHARLAPAPELAGLVQHFWIVRWDLRGREPQVAETLPHPNVHLVLEAGATRVMGVRTGRFTRTLSGRGGVFGVKFRPGGFRPVLGRSVSSLRDTSVPATEVFGEAVTLLGDTVFAQQHDARQVAAVERFLTERLPAPDPGVARIAGIVDAIAADRSVVAVEQLTRRWRIGKRRLQTLFNEYVGVGPKWVIKRYRLHEAVERLAEDPAASCTALAQELGYYDQAHFIRDFKALVGCTPAAYVRTR